MYGYGAYNPYLGGVRDRRRFDRYGYVGLQNPGWTGVRARRNLLRYGTRKCLIS
jgi:hypothetical protein